MQSIKQRIIRNLVLALIILAIAGFIYVLRILFTS
jgi:hypothetical protein